MKARDELIMFLVAMLVLATIIIMALMTNISDLAAANAKWAHECFECMKNGTLG